MLTEGLLAAAQRAEVGHRPVKADQSQQAFDELGRLPQRHAEQHLHCQASLNGSVAVSLLATTLACRRGLPAHLGIKPALRRLLAIAYRPTDSQRAPTLERFIVGGPVPRLVSWGYVSAHASQLPRWGHEMNPLQDLSNRATPGIHVAFQWHAAQGRWRPDLHSRLRDRPAPCRHHFGPEFDGCAGP
jgi:hypothetical protein